VHGARRKGDHKSTGFVTALSLAAAGLGWSAYLAAPAVAMHEVDHRFTVEGYVCGTDGRPVTDHEVVVKDTRVSVGATVFTDSRGYYKATLHLHNDNLGDPVLVTGRDEQKDTKIQFDPKDVRTERRVTVNFGAGCEVGTEVPRWAYFGAGLAVAVAAAFAGAKLIRSQRRRSQKRGTGQRKQHRS
jgi:hypothetical protein